MDPFIIAGLCIFVVASTLNFLAQVVDPDIS